MNYTMCTHCLMCPEQPIKKQFSSPIPLEGIMLSTYWGLMKIVVQRLLDARTCKDATSPDTRSGMHTTTSCRHSFSPKRLLWITPPGAPGSPLSLWCGAMRLQLQHSPQQRCELSYNLSVPSWNSSTDKTGLNAMKTKIKTKQKH